MQEKEFELRQRRLMNSDDDLSVEPSKSERTEFQDSGKETATQPQRPNLGLNKGKSGVMSNKRRLEERLSKPIRNRLKDS